MAEQSTENRTRADFAIDAIDAHAFDASVSEPFELQVSALITNTMHACDKLDISFGRCLARATDEYQSQVAEPKKPADREELLAALRQIQENRAESADWLRQVASEAIRKATAG